MQLQPEATSRVEKPKRRRKAPSLGRKAFLIPSLITVIANFLGFLAIISAFNGRYRYAALCIFVAAIMDFLDGRVARRLNATSDFGKELDSLSDLVAFGLAPAVLLYTWGFGRFADQFGIAIAFLFVACGATRLARFNIDVTPSGTEPKRHFQGLPIPGAAAATVALVYATPAPIESTLWGGALMLYTVLLSMMMVSTFAYPSLKHLKLRAENFRQMLLLISALVALSWYHSKLVLVVGTFGYAISGPLLYFFGLIRKRTGHENSSTASSKSEVE